MTEIAASKSEEYATARRYPRIVIDGFFDDWMLDSILGELTRIGNGATFRRKLSYNRNTSDLCRYSRGNFSIR
jgi:hypothetical protein